MVHEIWSVTDSNENEKTAGDTIINTCVPKTKIRQNLQSFRAIFFALLPHNNLKNQHVQKMKKVHGDIMLHLCTSNDDHMMYGS